MYTMTENEILALAEKYMTNRKSKYVYPGTLGKCEGNKFEVIFLKIEVLDPDIVIDPPDVRVLVDTKTKEVTWIHQI